MVFTDTTLSCKKSKDGILIETALQLLYEGAPGYQKNYPLEPYRTLSPHVHDIALSVDLDIQSSIILIAHAHRDL